MIVRRIVTWLWLLCLAQACTCDGTVLKGSESDLVAEPAVIDFGAVEVGRRVETAVVLTARGAVAVALLEGSLQGAPTEFEVRFSPLALDPEGTVSIPVAFQPSSGGPKAATFVIGSDATRAPSLAIELRGTGVDPPRCGDADGDGFGPNCAPGLDCDDANAAVNPGANETCGNGLDDDCDPATTDVCPPSCIDRDGDGYGPDCAPGLDCDDANAAVNPGASEACGNGLDDDCNAATTDVCPPPCIDRDADGYGQNCAPGSDCDDFKAFINPGQPERCGNVYDDDCNPATPDTCPVVCPSGGCGIGCADGEREGFVDLARYPAIAGCSGGFTVAGVFREAAPACALAAGDDGANPSGAGCNASDLCAPGWHVCRHTGEVAAKSVDGCAGADAVSGQFFATRQSGPGCGQCATGIDPTMQCGGDDCLTTCYPNDLTTNDLFGCGGAGTPVWGSSCGVLTKFGNNNCYSLPWPWDCAGSSGMDEALVVTKPGPAGGGVLCCAD